jgi:hypothetical protein
MAFPLSWLKRLRPTMLRATTTSGANSPFPAFTLPIIFGGDLSGRADDTDMARAEWSSPDHVGRALTREAAPAKDTTAAMSRLQRRGMDWWRL